MKLPDKFVEWMRDLLKEESVNFFDALNKDSVKAMTIDNNKISFADFEKDCDMELIPMSNIENAYYYKGNVGSNIYHHMGVIYSQDASAMLPVNALDVEKNDIVLDVCSAPGGKSIQILNKLDGTGLLVSNEYVYQRAQILYENMVRFGYKNYVVTNNIPSDFGKKIECFDKILVDAPCSGEGMFRKKDIEVNIWNEKNVETCAKRQFEILQSVAKLLRKGGVLVYSTCTYNTKENEEVVVNFLKHNPDYVIEKLPKEIADICDSGVNVDEAYDTTMCARRYPHKFEGEGQFIARLKRIGDDEINYAEDICIDKYVKLGRKDKEQIEKSLKGVVDITDLNMYKKGSNIYVAPNVNFDYRGLNVLSFGICMGSMDKAGIKLNHAFYKAYSKSFANVVNLTKQQAQTFITGNVVDNIVNAKNGVCVAKYNDIALGGGKIVDGVLKNYYPKELRNK